MSKINRKLRHYLREAERARADAATNADEALAQWVADPNSDEAHDLWIQALGVEALARRVHGEMLVACADLPPDS